LRSVGFTTQWRGQPDTSRWRLLGMIAVSALLHVPASPLMLLLAFLGLITLSGPAPQIPTESLNAIPIDLLETDDDSRQGEPIPEAKPEAQIVDGDDEGLTAPPPDAGVDETPAVEDAGVDDANAEDAEVQDAGLQDSGPDDSDVEDAGIDAEVPSPGVRDPVALAAEKTRVVDSNAAVSLTVYSENIRHHPLGPRVGRLVARLPQWQDFFGPSGIDPVRDMDRIMLVGPDFRDTAGLAVLVQHHLPNATIYNAINALVKRSKGGRWLEGTPLPAAQAYADRAERVFVVPSSYLVIVSPLSAKDSALHVPRSLRLPDPEGDEALVGVLKQPGYAFRKQGAPISIPSTIESLKYWISPLPDGGGRLRFVARDASEEQARESLRSLQDQIDQLKAAGSLAGIGAFAFKDQLKKIGLNQQDIALFVAILSRLSLTVQGDEIHGTLDGSQRLAEAVIARVEKEFGVKPPPGTR